MIELFFFYFWWYFKFELMFRINKRHRLSRSVYVPKLRYWLRKCLKWNNFLKIAYCIIYSSNAL